MLHYQVSPWQKHQQTVSIRSSELYIHPERHSRSLQYCKVQSLSAIWDGKFRHRRQKEHDWPESHPDVQHYQPWQQFHSLLPAWLANQFRRQMQNKLLYVFQPDNRWHRLRHMLLHPQSVEKDACLPVIQEKHSASDNKLPQHKSCWFSSAYHPHSRYEAHSPVPNLHSIWQQSASHRLEKALS